MTFIHRRCDLLFRRLWYVNFCRSFILKIVFANSVAYNCPVVVAHIYDEYFFGQEIISLVK